MLSYSSIVQRAAFAFLLCALAGGCSTKGAADFKQASSDYLGCQMTAPWPLELTSRDSSSVSFIRLDDAYSLPIYFRKSADGSWPEISDVPESNVLNVYHDLFEVKRVNAPLGDSLGGFEREFVIIIKQDSALVLPEDSGDYWQFILNSCDKMETSRKH